MRTDLHRPSQLVPADYTLVTTFAHPRFGLDGDLVEEGFGLEEVGEALSGAESAVFGDTSRCGSCGARFGSGALWQHTSGEFVFTGRDCADRMNLLADWSKVELAAKVAADRRKLALARQQKAADIAACFAANPGLEDALSLASTHRIGRDLADKLRQWGSLSPAQVALALKIADEVRTTPVEVHVPAPIGRYLITGKVVSLKGHDSHWGFQMKATLKMTTDKGSWLAWMTVPSGAEWNRGDVVTVNVTLSAGNEPHFAFGSRPKIPK
jgi:hypothetical protein